MKRKRKERLMFHPIAYRNIMIWMLGLTFLLFSCTEGMIESPEKPHTGPKVAVKFKFDGVVNKGNEVVTRSGANSLFEEAGGDSEEPAVIPLAEDLYMYATLEADSEGKMRAASSDLNPGVMIRVVAYLNGTTYHAHADYTVSDSKELTGDLLGVSPGNYKFVAYSYNTPSLPDHIFEIDMILDIYPTTDLLWGYFPETGTHPVVSSSREEVPITMSHLFSQVKIQATTADIPGNIPIEAIGGVSLEPGKVVHLTVKDAVFMEAGEFLQPFSSNWNGTGTTMVTGEPRIVNTNGSAQTHVTIGSVKLQGYPAFTDQTARFNKQLQPGVSYTLMVHFRKSSEETITVDPSYVTLSYLAHSPAFQTLTVTPMKGPNIDSSKKWTLRTSQSWLWLTTNADGSGAVNTYTTALNGTGKMDIYLVVGKNNGSASRTANITLNGTSNVVTVVTQGYFDAIGQPGTGIERIYIEDNNYNPKLMLTKDNTNPGAFFQFGGIKGWKQPTGSTNGVSATYNPSHTNSVYNSAWVPSGYKNGYVVEHTVASLRAGTGDPCRLVGFTQKEIAEAIDLKNPKPFAPDNQAWRLPDKGQLEGYTKVSTTFPRFGYVNSENGQYLENGGSGNYWGSWQSAGNATYTNAGLFKWNSNTSKIMYSYPPANLLSIRCTTQ